MKPEKKKRRLLFRAGVFLLLAVLCVCVSGPLFYDKIQKAQTEGLKRTKAGKRISIEDAESYAQHLSCVLLGVWRYAYDPDRPEVLLGEYLYDEDGYLTEWTEWSYDERDNIICEGFHTLHDKPGTAATEVIYEYDGQDRVVHEKRYQSGVLKEESFTRYLETGSAKVRYRYELGRTKAGEPQMYIVSQEEAVYNEKGEPLYCCNYKESDKPECVIRTVYDEEGKILSRMEGKTRQSVDETWTYDWTESEGSLWESVVCKNGEREQTERYLYNPDTDEWHLAGVWNRDSEGNISHVYRAVYDGELLLWEMECSHGKLYTFRTFCYQENGTKRLSMEYMQDYNTHQLILYHYEYDEKDRLAGIYLYDMEEVGNVQPFGTKKQGGYARIEFYPMQSVAVGIALYGPDDTLDRRFRFDQFGYYIEEEEAEE